MYGAGDCRENDHCGVRQGRGTCDLGVCNCVKGYIGSKCAVEAKCSYWDQGDAAQTSNPALPGSLATLACTTSATSVALESLPTLGSSLTSVLAPLRQLPKAGRTQDSLSYNRSLCNITTSCVTAPYVTAVAAVSGWSSAGLTFVEYDGAFVHCDAIHLTKFGMIEVPMSLDELLGETRKMRTPSL